MERTISPQTLELAQALRDNPDLCLAHYDNPEQPQVLHIYYRRVGSLSALRLPHTLRALTLAPHSATPFHDLRAPHTAYEPANENQKCQNEPVQLGTQCQPAGAPWVGTAGAPIKWRDDKNAAHWGFLSNWHVLSSGQFQIGTPCHQPDDTTPAFGRLAAMKAVEKDADNLVDCAVADTYIDGHHTTGRDIIGIGPYSDHPIVAAPGLAVKKSGRTTGLTTATCSAVGAAVTVGYGDFDAIFVDQDIFKSTGAAFSAAGDSGSLILGAGCTCACSLLFAGGGDLTAANPMRHVIDALDLLFPFP